MCASRELSNAEDKNNDVCCHWHCCEVVGRAYFVFFISDRHLPFSTARSDYCTVQYRSSSLSDCFNQSLWRKLS
jgi:hypothetical protein